MSLCLFPDRSTELASSRPDIKLKYKDTLQTHWTMTRENYTVRINTIKLSTLNNAIHLSTGGPRFQVCNESARTSLKWLVSFAQNINVDNGALAPVCPRFELPGGPECLSLCCEGCGVMTSPARTGENETRKKE